MANKIRKITPQGQAVKGAIAAYVAPKLAADRAIKPGEIDALLKSIAPKPYSQQIPLIADAIKKTFGPRLAKDLDIDDLPDILEALKNSDDLNEDENPDKDIDTLEVRKKEEALPIKDEDKTDKKDEDKSIVSDEDDYPGSKLMKMLGNYDIPPADLEQINELINAIGKGNGGDTIDAIKDEEKDDKKDVVTKPAMDAALRENARQQRENLQSMFAAAEDVAPIIGKIDTLAFDSAQSIYKMALDHLGIPTKGIHPSAFKTLLQFASKATESQPKVMAADAKASEDFNKRYTHIPMQA